MVASISYVITLQCFGKTKVFIASAAKTPAVIIAALQTANTMIGVSAAGSRYRANIIGGNVTDATTPREDTSVLVISQLIGRSASVTITTRPYGFVRHASQV